VARRTGLREFQLSSPSGFAPRDRAALSSKLGFQVGGVNWFVALHQVSEVIRCRRSCRALTQPWSAAWQTCGKLYSIVDFSAFQAVKHFRRHERRVILISDKLVGGAGLLVSRMLGLRTPSTSSPRSAAGRLPGWARSSAMPRAHPGTSSTSPARQRTPFPGGRKPLGVGPTHRLRHQAARRTPWPKHQRQNPRHPSRTGSESHRAQGEAGCEARFAASSP